MKVATLLLVPSNVVTTTLREVRAGVPVRVPVFSTLKTRPPVVLGGVAKFSLAPAYPAEVVA